MATQLAHRCSARPCRVKYLSPLLGVQAVTTYGYRAECLCEFRGPVRKRMATARMDVRRHIDAERAST